MKRLILYLMTGLCMVSATAQNVTYNHDAAKQNQFMGHKMKRIEWGRAWFG